MNREDYDWTSGLGDFKDRMRSRLGPAGEGQRSFRRDQSTPRQGAITLGGQYLGFSGITLGERAGTGGAEHGGGKMLPREMNISEDSTREHIPVTDYEEEPESESEAASMKGKTRRAYYAVAEGRSRGIYTDWDTARSNVHRYPGASHKRFETLKEAEDWLHQMRQKEK